MAAITKRPEPYSRAVDRELIELAKTMDLEKIAKRTGRKPENVLRMAKGMAGDPMKFATTRPYADPEAAARKLIEIAKSVEPLQDGWIFVEEINAPFTGTSAEYKAGLDLAIAHGWLDLHESGMFVKFSQAGAELFA